jgi:exodeoxyribonuclease V gamma subunit
VREIGKDLRSYLKRSGTAPDLRDLRQKLPEPVWEQLAEALGVFEPPRAEKVEDCETLTVSINTIRGFLECPLQGSAKFLLHMRDDDEEDLLTREDEAFETSRLHKSIILKRVFLNALREGKDLAATYEDVQTYHELRGDFPTGIFGDSERDDHLSILGNWREALSQLVDGKPAAPKVFRFGPAREFADAVDEVFPPVAIEVEIVNEGETKRRCVEIVGTTQPILESPLATLVPLTGSKNATHALRGFLNHVLLSAAGQSRNAEHTICLLEGEGAKPECFTYSPFTEEEARDYLATILRDMLSRVHGYLLPCETFIKLSKKKGVYLDRLNLPGKLSELHDSVDHTSSRFGPIKNPEHCYEPPSEDEALEIIHRRFDPLFDKQIDR